MKKNYLLSTFFLIGFIGASCAQTTFDWLDTAPDGNWRQGASGARWSGGLFDEPGYGILRFNNNHQLTMTNNVPGTYSTHQIIFGASNTDDRTISGISGNEVAFFDFSSAKPKIENLSTGSHTINFPIRIGFNPMEINPVSGNLTILNLDLSNNFLDVYGDSSNTLTVNGVISGGTGGVSIQQNSTVIFNGVNTYTGQTTVNRGDLLVNADMAGGIEVNNDGNLIVDTDLSITYLTINNTGTVTVKAGKSLTLSGNLTNNSSNSIIVESGASLIVGGTSTGNITYNRNLSGVNQWYLVSSPFSGETIEDMRTNHTFINGTIDANHLSFAPYNNAATVATERWDYITNTSTGTLGNAQGYLVRLNSIGNISFTGTMNTSDFTSLSLTDNSGASGTAFNFLGNPYPSYLNLNTLLTSNDAGGNDLLTESTVWIWNGTSYDERNLATTGANAYIAPAQGFFVSADGASSTFTITEAMQSHQGTDSFQKSANLRPEINLVINKGGSKRDINIYYIDGTSTGFDNGYDSSIFSGLSNNFEIYTAEVTNSTGKKLGIQSLPNTDLESMVIPVGIIADAGEITFSAEAMNLPSGLKVFLEDRTTNTFTRLDEANSNYKVTLTENTNGIGRFYLHTKSSALSTNDVTLENVSVYAVNKSTLKITGLSQGNSNIKVFNVLGKQVLNASFQSNGVHEVSLPNLSTGLYIVQLENESGKLSKKIVLE